MPTLKELSYEDRLRKLQLPTLQYRRLQGDMIEVFKILKGKYDKTVTDFLPLQQDSSTSLSNRGQSLKLYWLGAEKGARQDFFTIQVANNWNRLPSEVVESPTLMIFEMKLDAFWKEHELKLNFNQSDYSPLATKASQNRSQ